MGKCDHIIEKGKRKNQICGIYTNKTIENKFYCSSHINSHKKKEIIETPNEAITKPIQEIIKEPLPIKSLDNGDTLDEVIEYEYSKIKDKPDDVNNNELLNEINNINNRLFFIENQIKYRNTLDIPNYEIFK